MSKVTLISNSIIILKIKTCIHYILRHHRLGRLKMDKQIKSIALELSIFQKYSLQPTIL